jgi:hypothetical protein
MRGICDKNGVVAEKFSSFFRIFSELMRIFASRNSVSD